MSELNFELPQGVLRPDDVVREETVRGDFPEGALAALVEQAAGYAEAWTSEVVGIMEPRIRRLCDMKNHCLIPNMDRIDHEEAVTGAQVYYVGRLLARVITMERELEAKVSEAKAQAVERRDGAQMEVERRTRELERVKKEADLETKAAKAAAFERLTAAGQKVTAATAASANDAAYVSSMKLWAERVQVAQQKLADARGELAEAKSIDLDENYRDMQKQLLETFEQKLSLEALLAGLKVKASLLPGMQGRANAAARSGY